LVDASACPEPNKAKNKKAAFVILNFPWEIGKGLSFELDKKG